MRLKCVLVIGVLLLLPSRASAAPIGTFQWVHEVLFGSGSTFSVINESDEVFEDVVIDLFGVDDTSPFESLDLGIVPIGASVQSIQDLSLLLVPDDIDRVLLRFTFSNTTVTTGLLASSLVGDPLDFLTASAEISHESSPTPEPVPEPATILLCGIGIGLLGVRRQRSFGSRPPRIPAGRPLTEDSAL